MFGYYALPVLAGHQVVGWVCCTGSDDGLVLAGRFAGRPLTGKAFRAGVNVLRAHGAA